MFCCAANTQKLVRQPKNRRERIYFKFYKNLD